MNKQYDDEEDEIDLRELFFAIKAKIVMILAVAILGGLISFGYTKFLVTPMYSSTTSMLVLSKETTLTSLADLQLGTSLTNDYKVLAVSRPVLQQVVENLSLPITYKQLGKLITINNPTSSRILEFTVEYSDPVLAADIANELAEVAADYIAEQMEVIPPNIFETGIPATVPSSPSMMKNVIIGVMIGLLLSAGTVVVLTLMDDTIKDEEDIEKYLGLPVLAAVPDRKDYINTKERRKGDSRSHLKEDKKKTGPSQPEKVSSEAPVRRRPRPVAEGSRPNAEQAGSSRPESSQTAAPRTASEQVTSARADSAAVNEDKAAVGETAPVRRKPPRRRLSEAGQDSTVERGE